MATKHYLTFNRPTVLGGLLIVLGAALRIASMFGPLTHDELSAICRLRYDNLADVLTYGVKLGDTHPGGVEVLMWLWAQLFGTSAFAMRLPFVLMGIGSLPLIYAIGRRWYGEWGALLPTAVLALSQYTVYNSILARPYCAGLFFILCALYFLTRMIAEERYSLPNLALFAVFEACCAYTHYFCSLTALLMALGALLFVPRRHLLPYLLSCGGAVALFLPHLGITFHQLFEYKGIGGWLGEPKPTFALDYLRYLTHHSPLAAAGAAVAYLLVFNLRSLKQNVRLVAAAGIVGLLPMAIGYVYSVAVNPVMHFAVLIFAFPLLTLALAGGVDNEARRWRHALAAGIYSIAMTATLIVNRHHFSMLQKEWIGTSVEVAQRAIRQYGDANVGCLFNVAPDKVAYYDSTLTLLPTATDEQTLDSLLAAYAKPYLVCAGIQNPFRLEIVRRHYPYLLQKKDCVTAGVYLASRLPADSAIDLDSVALATVDRVVAFTGDEFTDILDTSLGAIADSRFVYLECRLDYTAPAGSKSVLLVSEISIGGTRVDWRAVSTGEPHLIGDSLRSVILPVRVHDVVKRRRQVARTQIRLYLWNPDGDSMPRPMSCHIRMLPGNPYLYSVLEEM